MSEKVRKCSESVLGFYKKDGYSGKHFTGREREAFWQVKEKDIVPVVSKKEHEKALELEREWFFKVLETVLMETDLPTGIAIMHRFKKLLKKKKVKK